jgi:CRP-like cAMP-binding protein
VFSSQPSEGTVLLLPFLLLPPSFVPSLPLFLLPSVDDSRLSLTSSSLSSILCISLLVVLCAVNGKNTLKYEEDLFPGDCFAESALDGIRNRLATVQAVTTCDIAVVEYHDFAAATIENSQKESVDDRIQFLTRTPIFRHWDGVDLYRIASAMTREEYPKSTVMISKGDISKKLCLLMEGRIDVVVGLNPHQMQHVVTTINQHECFNESGILTQMSVPVLPTSSGDRDRTESFVESCFAVSGSHVMLLCLSENNYHLLDQSTIEKLSIAFREKNIWRLNRMVNLRAESRNINKWKKKISLERQLEDAKWKPPPKIKPRSDHVVIDSLEDIPALLDSVLDPMLAISTCRNSKEIRQMQLSIKESYRPKSARAATVRKCLDGASSMIKQTGPKRTLYLSRDRQDEEVDMESSPLSPQGHYSPIQQQAKKAAEAAAASGLIRDRPDTAPPLHSSPFPEINARGSLPTRLPPAPPIFSNSRHLMGSSYIPSAKSFCDTVDRPVTSHLNLTQPTNLRSPSRRHNQNQSSS